MSERQAVIEAFSAKGYPCVGLVSSGPLHRIAVRYYDEEGHSHVVSVEADTKTLLGYAARLHRQEVPHRVTPGNKVLRIDVKKGRRDE